MADVQNLEALLRQGVELTRAKRFREAEPIFQQVLTLEPRHTGAAYLLSVCLYFTGQFQQALYLFSQLTQADSPLEPAQIQKLSELSYYARYEALRLDYWVGLKLKDPDRVGKELKNRNWEIGSLEGFHLSAVNGRGMEWLQKYSLRKDKVDVRILNRAGRVVLLPDCTDADETIGAHLESVRQAAYGFIPLRDLSAVEFGPLKRWITAQVAYRDGRRETVQTPLTYRDSMSQSAWGIQEGVETLLKPSEEVPSLSRAYGQKQFRSASGRTPLSEILRMEF